MCIRDRDIDFKKCIYLDKDMIQGIKLEMKGVRLYNNIGVIEQCDDKRRTYELLKKDFKLPETISGPLTYFYDESSSKSFCKKVVKRLGLPLIAKFAYGSLGENIVKIETLEQLIEYNRLNYQTPLLYQKYIKESSGKDIRVYVVGGTAVAAMSRENDGDFRANVSLGGKAENIELTPEICEIAESAASFLRLDYCGVDLLYSKDSVPYICEINSNALFDKISEVSGINIARIIARMITEDDLSVVSVDINEIFS